MKFSSKSLFIFFTLILFGAFSIKSALAHSFNVALIIPITGDAVSIGNQMHKGFMLATTEKDAHPDEKSDGHLGGLDVYVSIIDAQNIVEISNVIKQGEIDIVVLPSFENLPQPIANILEGQDIAILLAGDNPFNNSEMEGVINFIASYKNIYTSDPSDFAAQGYNAAQRIDRAVKAQGSVDDKSALNQNFNESAKNFSW